MLFFQADTEQNQPLSFSAHLIWPIADTKEIEHVPGINTAENIEGIYSKRIRDLTLSA